MSPGIDTDNAESVDEIIDAILEGTRTIAVVGLSDDPSRPSNRVARTLIKSGYRVIGVNPNVEEVLGLVSFPQVAMIPEKIDLVNVFRRSDAIEPIVDEVINLNIPNLCLQEGVTNEAAAARARQAGIQVIMDRCIAKELNKRSL